MPTSLQVREDIYMRSAVFKQQKGNLSWVFSDLLRLLATLSRNPDVTAGIDFYTGAGEESVREPSRAPPPLSQGNFLGGIHWPFLREIHLGPCVYAGLTLKCGHKLDPFATKS